MAQTDLVEGRLVATGVPGLDEVLVGGFAANRVHLVEGAPGAGKTTLAMQFLLDGLRHGERGLYITLSETRDELAVVAASHGWSLDGLDIFELVPPEGVLPQGQEQSVIYASELELGETMQLILAEVERVAPSRIVFDSLSEIRLLAQNSLRYRRQMLALKHFFAGRRCTVLLLDDMTGEREDLKLHSMTHGVLRLEQLAALYGGERRRLRVVKMRATAFRGGFHDLSIRRGGVVVFPRLAAADHLREAPPHASATSDIPELDALLGGGLDRGTSSLLIGPSGSGKSTLALQYVAAALKRGEKTVIFSFDEARHVVLQRAAGLGHDLRPAIAEGRLQLERVNPAELSPGEFAAHVRASVERHHVGMVVVDSLNGYLSAMPEEQFVTLQMHELLTYLNQQGVLTIMVLAQHGLVGAMQTPVDLTYLSDTVLLLRFFEAAGEIRRAVSVVKKRTGAHERWIREYRIDAEGVRVGPPLAEFQGVLTGVPTYTGSASPLLRDRSA